MAFILDPQTGKITFGVVADSTHDAIARDIASEFGVSENFKDNFSTYLNQGEADTAWLPQDTPVNQVDITNDNYFFTIKRDGTNIGTSHDLGAGNVSDTMWVLRCKVTIGAPYTVTSILSAGLNISLTDTDSSTPLGSDNDLIQTGLINTIIGGGAQHAINNLDNGVGGASTTGTTTGWVAGETIYIELKRESATSIRSTIFTDASYTVIRDSITKTIPASVVGLRYIRFGGATDVTGWNGTFTGTVDDVQFWNGITVPVITSKQWRMRFTLDITALSLPSTNDLSMWIGLFDEDETSDSTNLQDSFQLSVFVDQVITSFATQTADNQAPRTATTDKVFAIQPSVNTFFIEMKRNESQTTVTFFTDNTFTTALETESQAGISGTDNLKYLKLLNDVLGNNANTMDGTFDDFTFDDLSVQVINEREFIVDAILIVNVFTCGTKILFQDDFTTAVNWTQIGTGTSVTGGEVQGWGLGAIDRRVFHDLVTPLSDKSWKVEFEFEFSAFSAGTFGPTHDIFGLSNVQAPATTAQDFLGVRMRGSNSVNTFQIVARDGQTINPHLVENPTPASINTRYFVRFERITTGQVKMSIFTGGFDVTPFGVPLTGIIPTTITGLRFVSSANNTIAGSARSLTGILDNLVITNGCCAIEVNALLKKQNVNLCSSQQVVFTQSSGFDLNWIIQGNSSISPLFGGGSIGFAPNTDNINDAVARDLSDPSALGQLVSDNEFDLVFSINLTGLTNGSVPFVNSNAVHIGLSTADQTVNFPTGGTDDAIYVRIINTQFPSSGALQFPRWQLFYKDGSGTVSLAISDDNPNDNPILGTQWVKIERLSPTTIRMIVATDSGFTNVRYDTGIVAIPSTVGGLRYMKCTDIKFFNSQPALVNGTFDNITLTTIANDCFQVDALLQSQGDVRCVGAPLIFFDGMNDASQWTVVGGSQIVPNDIAGVMEWNALQGGATANERFAFRTIPNFADNLGEIRIRVKVDKISDSSPINPTGRFIVLQNNALHPNPSTGSAFQIALGGGSPNGSIFCAIFDGVSGSAITTPRPTFLNGTTKFLEGIYDPVGQTLTLNIYTDAGFSIHDTGSPIQVDASAVSMTGLIFTHMITSNVKNSGPARVINADLDDFQIGGANTCPSPQVDALLQTQGDNGSCSGNYMDSMGSQTGWLSTDDVLPAGFMRIASGVLDWNAVADNTNDTIATDLTQVSRLGGLLSDTDFRVRFKVGYGNVGLGAPFNHVFFYVSDSDQNTNAGVGTEDAIGWHVQVGVSGQVVTPFHKDGSSTLVQTGNIQTGLNSGNTFFYEMIRSGTSVTFNVYNDSLFTNLVATQIETVPATVTGLKFFKTGNWDFGNISTLLTGSLDDLEIISSGAVGNVACPEVDSVIIERPKEEFTVNAIIIALGENGSCPIPATTNFYSVGVGSLAERLGDQTTRAGEQVIDSTHAGKAIEDVRWFLRRNGVGATGTLFATVRNKSDFVIAISTNSVLAEALPTSGFPATVFTFPERIVLQEGDRVLLEFPNCIGCGVSAPNVFMFGPLGAPPAGWSRTFFRPITFPNTGYNDPSVNQDFRQSGDISFGTSSAIPARQRACADVSAVLQKAPQDDHTFEVDAFVFILPVINTFVNAILQAFDQEKEFTIDACLQNITREEFEVDACLQIEDTNAEFRVDALIFILPVALTLVNAIVRYAQGTSLLGGIPDLIIRVLRENPPSLTGLQIVDEIVKITSDPAEGFSFRGKTSRIKNWLNRLRLDNLIIDDGSNPDWYRTNWSLNPAVFPSN